MKRQSIFVISMLLALLISVAGGAQAQETTPEATEAQKQALSYGTPVTGAIDNTVFQQAWTLATASADRVLVRVKRTSGNLIPDISILDESGNPLSQSYGSDYTYAAAQIDDYTLPAAGSYVIQVTRYGGQDGETKGGYTLEVIPLGTGEENPNNQTVIGEVPLDTPVDGEITATRWRHQYTFTAQAADAINVIVERTGGTLNPVVDVLDANATSLRYGYNDGAFAETGEFELPAAGLYTIVVGRNSDQDGDTLGTYALTVRLVGAGEGSPLLEVAPGTVTYDQELNGNITNAQWYQDWRLTADAEDTLTISVERTDGDLNPEVILLGGSSQELTHGYTDRTDAAAKINRYQLAGPGTYTVRVTRETGKTGETSGAYALTVTLNGAGEGSPRLDEPSGAITPGEPVEGEITGANWLNIWTFSSEQGSISVNVERGEGTLSPTLEIRDANGQTLTSTYPTSARDSAEIEAYQLPSPGRYQIVVSRESGQDGETSGGYTLSVNAAS